MENNKINNIFYDFDETLSIIQVNIENIESKDYINIFFGGNERYKQINNLLNKMKEK